ncbi:MAG: hypothetical protein SFV32_12700 [Opitutaceae bacterium]|nr:hypothetical protein [Opitutaceae bacterium]
MKSLKNMLTRFAEQDIPKGAESVEEIAKREGWSIDHTRRMCARGIEAGLIKPHSVRRRARNGVVRPHTFFEILGEKKPKKTRR